MRRAARARWTRRGWSHAAAAWRRVLSRLDHGVTEVLCHPGQSGPETEALMSAALRRAIDAVAERTSFRALGQHA
jgi:hypothetical protein